MAINLAQTVAQHAAAALRKNGVEFIFGQSLPTMLMLAAEDVGIRQIVYRAENAGGAMADGYARCSNKVGVVAAQNGPAATLLVPPLGEAFKASIPIVALVQEVNRTDVDRNAFQEFDHIRLFDSCTKWVRRIDHAERVTDYIDMAFVAAASGRPGPVALLFPADLLLEEMPATRFRRTAALGSWPLDRMMPSLATIDEAAKRIANADNPIVVAGGGVHSASAYDELAKLQGLASLPVAYTTMGKGAVADTHPLTMGLSGNIGGHRSTAKFMKPIVDRADLVLLVGTRTNQNGTDGWTIYPESAAIIHIDVDAEEIGRTYEADVRLPGDAKLTLDSLANAMAARDLSKRRRACQALTDEIAAAKRLRLTEISEVWASEAIPLRPERVMRELQSAARTNTVFVADASYSSAWIASYIDAEEAGRYFVTPRGLAGLGWGYPMALGAKVARPQSNVVAVVGDGGFGHCWSELETAKRMGLAVTVVVLNNALLGYQKDAELAKFGRHTSAIHFEPVDHARIAEACGVRSARVETLCELRSALELALGSDEPWLLDVCTDPNAFPPVTLFDGLCQRNPSAFDVE